MQARTPKSSPTPLDGGATHCWGCYVAGDGQYSNHFESSGGLSLCF
jgi:hypothetical protein